MPTDFSRPVEVDGLRQAFGVGVERDLMPAWEDIPDEFRRWNGNEWVRIASTWFCRGLNPRSRWVSKEGVETDQAIRHLRAVMVSFEPKHEHKEAAIGYLMSLWFERIENWEPVRATP